MSQFNQRMTIHSQNETLMCKVFPSSLGPVAMRWFNDLKTNSGLTNKKEWKRTSCKGKERRMLSLKRGVILGRTDTTITIQGEISQGNQDQPTRRRLPPYSENRYIRFWRKSTEPFFKWPNKMAGDSIKHNRSLYCQYLQDHGHTTEDYRNLWNHLD